MLKSRGKGGYEKYVYKQTTSNNQLDDKHTFTTNKICETNVKSASTTKQVCIYTPSPSPSQT
jgi:hypothetical protein